MSVNIYRGDLQACRVCLATDIKLMSLQDHHLKYIYSEFSGVPIMATDNLPQHICTYCCALLKKSSKFKQKCMDTYTLLSGHLLEMHALTTSYIDTIDKSHLRIPLKTTETLEFSCIDILDKTCFTPEDADKNALNTASISTPDDDKAPVDCVDDNSYKDHDANFENDSFESEDEAFKNLKDESAEIKLGNEKQKQIDNSNITEKLQTDDDERIEDFKSNYCNKIMNSDQELFYLYILEKYLKKSETEKSNYLISGNNSHSDTTVIPAFIDSVHVDDSKAHVEKYIEICNTTQNLNQKRFYEYVSNTYGNGKFTEKSVKQKKITDITKLKVKKKVIKGITLTKEYLAKMSKDYNVDVVLLLKEDKIEDLLERKKTERYRRAKYRCELCYTGFAVERTFQNHMAAHDPSAGAHECEFCHVRFKHSRLWRRHMQLQHRYKFVCRQCGRVSRNCTMAREHYKCHAGHSYVCEQCGQEFDKYQSRMNHMRIHHGSVSCEVCHMKFAGLMGLVTHKTRAHKELFKCLSCSVQFHNENALRRHRRVAAAGCGPDIRPCTQCGDSFPEQAPLVRHIFEHHPPDHVQSRDRPPRCRPRKERGGAGEPLMCEVCGKEGFKFVSSLESHQRNHSNERSAICDYCNKGFRDKYKLRTHLATHTDERRYSCALCRKAFRQPSHLAVHAASHTNEKRHSCSLCHERFKSRASLRRHAAAVHEGLPEPTRI